MQILIECDDAGAISKIEMVRHGKHDPIVYTHGAPGVDGAVKLSPVPDAVIEAARWAAGRLREIRTERLRAALIEHGTVAVADVDAVLASLTGTAPTKKKRR